MLSAALCASFKDVEHRCQQCGTTVEDGRPFCPQCRAPQISVKVAVADDEVAPGVNSSRDQYPPDIPVETRLASSQARLTSSDRMMNRTIAARAAIKAGVLGFVMGIFLPLLAIVLAGALSVYFYRRESGLVLSTALGSRLGGAAGVVAAALQSIYFVVWLFVFHNQKTYIDSLTRFLHSIGADASLPDIQASIHILFTPGGLAVGLFFVMLVALVLSSVGGALASLWMRSRGPQL